MLAANLPFANERLFGAVALRRMPKPLWLRLLELLVFYFAVGGLALLAERQLGPIYSQRWEFYATTATLFITLAFPGFVWCYLRKA